MTESTQYSILLPVNALWYRKQRGISCNDRNLIVRGLVAKTLYSLWQKRRRTHEGGYNEDLIQHEDATSKDYTKEDEGVSAIEMTSPFDQLNAF